MNMPEPIEAERAGLSLWREAPSLNGLRTAALGAFSCETSEDGAALLISAAERLRGEGFQAALGPMDGDTWSTHRLVTESDGSPPFLLEPHNPAHYPAAFDQAGFLIVSRYVSAETDVHEVKGARWPEGISLRSLDASRAEEELRRIHTLSLQAFSDNAFYQSIAAERFVASYAPVLNFIDPELVLLAEDGAGVLKGFLFGVPNFAEGPKPDSVILKTYASSVRGLGSALVAEFYRRASEKGFRRMIHALMHEDNLSLRHSYNVGGRVFRRYALWARTL